MTTEKSSNARILSGFLWVSLFLFLGKIAGAAKEMAVAWRYGVSPIVDAYVFVFNMLAWPGAVFGGALLAFLPPLIVRWKQIDKSAVFLFQRELLGITLYLGILFTLLGSFTLWLGLHLGWINCAIGQRDQYLEMIFSLSGIVIPSMFIAFFSAWTLAEGRQVNSLFEGAPSVIICFFLLLPINFSMNSLALGTLFGFFIHISLFFYIFHRSKLLVTLQIRFSSPVWRDFFSNFFILILGQIAITLTSMLDLFAASRLSSGDISILNYGNKFLMLVTNLAGIAINRSILPVFSQIQDDEEKISNLVFYWVKIVFFLGVLLLVIGWIFAPYGVSLFFERGAFGVFDSRIVVDVFRYGLFQLPFYFIWMVFVSQLSASWGFKLLGIIFTLIAIVKFCALYFLVAVFGLRGIQLASTAAYAGGLFFLWIWRQKIRNIDVN